MTDHDTVERLRTAMAVETRDHHLPADAARRAWDSAARRSRTSALAVAAALVTVLTVAAIAWLVRPGSGGSSGAAGTGCTLDRTPLPVWARDGFSPDAIDTPHVIGAHGRIVAIPFVTLRVRQGRGTNNKVLWVARDGAIGTLSVRATLGDSTVTRTVPLGPSYLDLPAAGCWSLDLRWAGHRDALRLRVRP